MTEKVRVLPEVGSVADLVRCLRNITDLYEELQGHPTASSREARAALRTQDSQSVNVGNNCSEDGQRIAGTDCGSGLVERLREFSTEWEKLTPRLAAARGGDLAEEAAEALAAAEARIAAAYVSLTNCPHDMGYDLECGPIGCRLDLTAEGGCVCSGIGPALAPSTDPASLPALLAETRKKALEEAAQVAENTVDFNDDGLSTFDAAQIITAAIRALAEEVRTPSRLLNKEDRNG